MVACVAALALWASEPALVGAAAGDEPAALRGDERAAGASAGDARAAGEPDLGRTAGDPRERFALANRCYQEDRFAEAARLYESVLDEGLESPALYLNLGNARLRAGELGGAIVAYRRGLRLAPRDHDLLANLAFAQAQTQDVVPEASSSIFLDRLAGWLRKVSAREALILAAAVYWLAVGVFIVGRLVPARRRAAGVALWVLTPLLVLTAGLAVERTLASWGRHEAVILPASLAVRNGPGEDYAVRFELHEGTTVTIRRRALDWLEIELTDKLNGWVPARDVAPI